jgi:hypothetical protein
MACHRTRSSVIGRRLTASATARPLAVGINLNYTKLFGLYRTVNTSHISHKTSLNAVYVNNHRLFMSRLPGLMKFTITVLLKYDYNYVSYL